MSIVIPSGSNQILFIAEASESLVYRHGGGGIDNAGILGKWEIDPDDGKSVQFRIPSASFGGNNDRIGFYISASGRIGLGTKDPESAFDVRDIGEDRQLAEDEEIEDHWRTKESLIKLDRDTGASAITASLDISKLP